MRAEQLTEPLCYHGEGPVWWPRTNALRWLDMLRHEDHAAGVWERRLDGAVTRFDIDGPVCAVVRPRRAGGAVYATEHDVWVSDHDDLTAARPVAHLTGDANIRCNEGGCDPEGRFYVGTMSYDRTPGLGTYFRCDGPDRDARVVVAGTSTSNGVGWSPDGRHVYLNDTPTHRVDMFDVEADGWAGRRTFVDLAGCDGRPDGLAVDAEGGVWVALIGQGKLHRYDPAGTLSQVVEVPASRVTSCAFGGEGLATLFITTSQEKAAAGEEGVAGALFCCEPGVAGQPTAECAW